MNGNAGNKYLEKKIGRLLTFGVWLWILESWKLSRHQPPRRTPWIQARAIASSDFWPRQSASRSFRAEPHFLKTRPTHRKLTLASARQSALCVLASTVSAATVAGRASTSTDNTAPRYSHLVRQSPGIRPGTGTTSL